MQQFVVPQFIDVEDKIFGPVTTRQFLILLVAFGICFLGYRFADLALFTIILAVVGGGSIVLAFVKVNGQSFHYFLLNILQTIRKPGRRIWHKALSKEDLDFYRKRGLDQRVPEVEQQKIVRRAHIRDLALQVNTGGYYNPNQDDEF